MGKVATPGTDVMSGILGGGGLRWSRGPFPP